LIDLGTYEDIAFNHSFPGRLEVTLAWTADKAIEIIDLAAQAKKKSSTLASSKNLTFSVDIRLDKNDATVQCLKYSLGDTTFALTEKDLGKYELTSDRYNFVRSPGRAWPLPAPTRFYGFPDQVRLYYQNAGFLSELELELEAACSRIKYLGPLREHPRRQYTFFRWRADRSGQTRRIGSQRAHQLQGGQHKSFARMAKGHSSETPSQNSIGTTGRRVVDRTRHDRVL